MPWEPEDGWNRQDNNLPFFHSSDRAKDIPKFLPAAGAGILCSKRCLLKRRKQTPSRHPVLTTWSMWRHQIRSSLEQKLTFQTIWSRTELGRKEGRNFLFCSRTPVSFGWYLHLGQIWSCFTRVELFGICLSAAPSGKPVTGDTAILVFFYFMCLSYRSFAFFWETSPPDGVLVAIFITMTDW